MQNSADEDLHIAAHNLTEKAGLQDRERNVLKDLSAEFEEFYE